MNSQNAKPFQAKWSLVYLLPFLAFSWYYWGLQADDALIYQRYLQNVLDGHGLVYNPGERYNAVTSPLYVALGAAFSVLLGNVQLATMLLSLVFTALALVLFQKIFSVHSHGVPLSLSGAVFVAFSPYVYSVFGMETGLFLYLISLCIWLFHKNDVFWLGIACALLLVTRGEGVFLVVALAVEHLRQRRPFPHVKYFVIPTLIVAALFAFNWLYFGHVLPDTLSAKVGQGRSGLWGEWPVFVTGARYLLDWYLGGSVWVLMAWLALALAGLLRPGGAWLKVICLTFLLFYCLFYVALNIPQYHWYYAPIFVLGYFYAGVGFSWLISAVSKRKPQLTVGIATVALGAFMATSVAYAVRKPLDFPGYEVYVEVGEWLKSNTPAQASVAAAEIGKLGYASERYIIDMLGLVSPPNAELVAQRQFTHWIRYYDPDYMLVHQPVWPHELGALMAVLLGDWSDPAPGAFSGMVLLQGHGPAPRIFPADVVSRSGPGLVHREHRYALLLKTPSRIVFDVPPGLYSLGFDMGLHNDTPAADSRPARAMVLEISMQTSETDVEVLYSQPLSRTGPGGDEAQLALSGFLMETPRHARVTIELDGVAEPGEDGAWAWWRNLRLEEVP